jgi:hypothetical protein
MKLKFSCFLLALTCALTSQAQIDKGSVLVGSNIGYSQGKSKFEQSIAATKINTFTISPSFGVAIKENLVAGVRFAYSKQTQKSTLEANSTYDVDNKSYGGGIFIRRYVPVINRLYVFGEGTAAYTSVKQTSTQKYYNSKMEQKTTGYSTGLSFTPGISYGVCKKFQIEGGFNSLFSAAYVKTKTTGTTSNTQKADLFSAGIGQDDESMFYVGFKFVL